jgi:hypothetical protein
MKKEQELRYLCGCRYCSIEYRFGFISIFSFGLAGIIIPHNIQNPSRKILMGFFAYKEIHSSYLSFHFPIKI